MMGAEELIQTRAGSADVCRAGDAYFQAIAQLAAQDRFDEQTRFNCLAEAAGYLLDMGLATDLVDAYTTTVRRVTQIHEGIANGAA